MNAFSRWCAERETSGGRTLAHWRWCMLPQFDGMGTREG